MVKDQSIRSTRSIVMVGVFAALCYIGFQFFRIDIPVGTQKTAFHLGNVFLMVAALLFGGVQGGLAGAIGMTIADVTSGYLTSAVPTFILKFFIGLVVGVVAARLGLARETEKGKQRKKVVLSLAAGALFNLIADPIVRYLYNLVIYGIPGDLAKKLAALGSMATAVNGVLAIIMGIILYFALLPAIRRTLS